MDKQDVVDMMTVYMQSPNSAHTMCAVFGYNFKIGILVRHQVMRDDMISWVSLTLNSAL